MVRSGKDFSLISRASLLAAALLVAALTPVWSQAPQPVPPLQGTILFRIIVVESPDAARRVLDQLAAGENFVALAQKVSVDATGRNGGLVGPISVSDLRGELRAALEGLRVGEMSGVVRVPTGFAVLKLVPASEAGAGGPSASRRGGSWGASRPRWRPAAAVKYVFDISGYIETVLSLRQVRGRQDADENMLTLCEVRKQLFASAQGLVAKTLATAGGPSTASPIDLAVTYFLKGQLHSFEGKMGAGRQGLRTGAPDFRVGRPDLLPQMDQALGIAHLHKAEMDNGVFHAPGERCLLSRAHHGGLANNADVAKAIEYFTRYLHGKPDELEVRWLLNVAHMFAGHVSGRRARAQLIPPDALEVRARTSDGSSTSRRSAGLHSVSTSGGVIVDDFDKDGQLDVVTSSIDSCEPMRLFRRERRRHVHGTGGEGRSRRAAWRAEHRADRLQQRRASRHPGVARRDGKRRSANRCCATTATGRLPT